MWPGIIQWTKELKRTKRGGQMNGFSGEGKLIEKASWMSLVLTPVTLTPPPKPYFISYLTALCSSPTWRSSCMATSPGSPPPKPTCHTQLHVPPLGALRVLGIPLLHHLSQVMTPSCPDSLGVPSSPPWHVEVPVSVELNWSLFHSPPIHVQMVGLSNQLL